MHNLALHRPQSQRKLAIENFLDNGFPYSRNLDKHASCVNALAFSSLDGQFLASGGDDLNIHLWDLYEERVETPSYTFRGPRRNIFVLAFSAHNRFLFSGGVDDIVRKYDVSRLERPHDPEVLRLPDKIFCEHDANIRGIAPHAFQDEIYLSGSEDGRVIVYDGRASVRAQDILQLTKEVTGVQFHPRMEHVFATCEGGGHVCLRDMRMAFGPLSRRTRDGVVQLYNTKISRRSVGHLANPETSSVTFNRQGTLLAVTMLNYLPTIYGLKDSDPIAVCSGRNLPDGTPVSAGARTYGNCCTMKHGSFGGPGLEEDTLYAAGSDDFSAYIWAVPPPEELIAQRTIIKPADWDAHDHAGIVAFAESATGPRCVPVQLDTPRARLGGHTSIVNTVVVHPRMLLAATAGIESRVVLHGAVGSLCGGLTPTSAHRRDIGAVWEWDGDKERLLDESWVEDQRDTIDMFDGILLDEAGADVFELRRWTAEDSDSEDEDSSTGGADEVMSSVEEEDSEDAVVL